MYTHITNSHTHTLSISHTYIYTHSLSHTHTHTFIYTHTLTHLFHRQSSKQKKVGASFFVAIWHVSNKKFDIPHVDSLSLILIGEADHVEVNKQNQKTRRHSRGVIFNTLLRPFFCSIICRPGGNPMNEI